MSTSIRRPAPRSSLRAVACGMLVALAACASPASEPAPTLEAAPTARIMNEATYGAYVFGGMPDADALQSYKDAGVQRVVSLRTAGEPEGYDEAATCAALGLEFERLPFDPSKADAATVDPILDEFRAGPGDGTLVHCGSGNRVAMLFAVHRVIDDGVDLEQALAEARAVGMKPGPAEEFVRAEVARRAAP